VAVAQDAAVPAAAAAAAVVGRTTFDAGSKGGAEIIGVAIAVVTEGVAASAGVATTGGTVTAAAAAVKAMVVAAGMNDRSGGTEAAEAAVVEGRGGTPHLTVKRPISAEIAVRSLPQSWNGWQQSGHASARSWNSRCLRR